MKDEYNREIEADTGLVNSNERPLQDVLEAVGKKNYGKQSARYFTSLHKRKRPRYAVR